MKIVKNSPKKAQEIQDRIFRRMPAAKKIRLASNLFALAKKLNKTYFYGAGRVVASNRRTFKQA